MAGEPGGVPLLDQQPAMDGGLNNVSDDILVQPNQLRKAINCRLTDYGAITKRGGTQRVSDVVASASILNGYTWRRDGGTQQLLVVTNERLYTATYGAFPITWTQRTGAVSATVSPTFAQFRDGTNDVVYITDGGLLNKWDGTTFSVNLANTSAVESITVHNQRLWGCGNSSFPDSIFYSALNNGDSLGNASASGGQIVVRTFGDETVVGLASINTSLMIFHRRGISRLTGYGQDDITVEPAGVTADVGVIARHSIVSIGNLGFFVSERGLYMVNEAEVAPVGTVDKPDPLLAPIRALTSTQFDAIRAAFNRATRELWISIPGYGVYVYHTVLRSWAGPWDTGYLSPATTAIWETLNTAGLPVMLRGDASGYVSLCDAPSIYLDNVAANGTGGTRYSMTAQLHRLYSGDDALAKSLRYGYLTAQLNGSDSCSVTWKTDMVAGAYTLPVSTAGLWGSGTWGSGSWGGPSSKNYRVQMGGTGYYTDITIIDSGRALPVFSRFQLASYALGRR
jgi:hypothetical protein